jgi:hypothetical protein
MPVQDWAENPELERGHYDDRVWIRRTTRLRFHLGEYCFASWKISCLSLRSYYTKLPAHPSETSIPKTLPTGAQALFLPSHPAPEDEPRLGFAQNMIRYVPVQVPRYFVELKGSFEDYLRRFSSKPRHNLQRSVKKFTEYSGGKLDFREYTTPEQVDEFYALAQQVSQKTYQARLLQAGLPSGPEFRPVVLEQARQGHFHGYLLLHDGRPISFVYCWGSDNCLIYDNIGYDAEYQKWSPGTILLYLILERQFGAQEYTMLDFGTGQAQYKNFFATGFTRCADIYYFRPTPWNTSLVLAHSSLHYLNSWTVRLLQRMKLKDWIKKLIRNRAARPERGAPS